MIPKKLKVFAFFFATFLTGVFVGGATVDLLDQQEQVEAIPFPVAPSPLTDDLLQTQYFNWGPHDKDTFTITNWNSEPEYKRTIAKIHKINAELDLYEKDKMIEYAEERRSYTSAEDHGTTIGVPNPYECHATICIGPQGWAIDMDDIAIDFDEAHSRLHMHAATDDGVAWADITDPNTSTMPAFGAGSFYVEPLYGTKLQVRQVLGPDGKYLYDIYAMPSKEAIFGNTNKRAAAIARSDAERSAGQHAQ